MAKLFEGISMKKKMSFEEMITELQNRGTQVITADACMCAKCVERRKKHGTIPMRVVPEKSDDPIQEANRKMAIDLMTTTMRKTKQAQRKRKQRKKKKEE
tara:strand:+ start:7702 stop:8001 length:300 start_codon:yes stop_codon:yes gene_type:complete